MAAYAGPMQLTQLAYFVAVAEEGSFTRAAERVGEIGRASCRERV